MRDPEYGPVGPETAKAIIAIDGSIAAWRIGHVPTPADIEIEEAAAMANLRSKWSGRRPDEH